MSPALYLFLAIASGAVYWAAGRAVRRAYDNSRQQQGGNR